MIHAQIIRDDEINKMREIGMIPSYFVAHTYYWGDTHIKNLKIYLLQNNWYNIVKENKILVLRQYNYNRNEEEKNNDL